MSQSSQLFRKSLQLFIEDARRHQNEKDLKLLDKLLAQNVGPEHAQKQAEILKDQAGKKFPTPWIDKLMRNIGHFVAIGNYAMTGAPESVGLAWFAVKLTLSAIHSNYELYSFFGSALTDITEIMIIIPHYDGLYDERLKGHEWKSSPVVQKLFDDIITAYTAVLHFSFSVQRHLSAGALARLRHGIRDFFGESKTKFEGDMTAIASYKNKILEDSQAIFQDKALHQIDSVKVIVDNIRNTVKGIRSFQETFQRMHQEQSNQLSLLIKGMEDIKSTTKPKTPWDVAIQTFEKNKEALNPQKHTIDGLVDALNQQHPGTCLWVFQCSEYKAWYASTTNSMLCIEGQEDSGKTTVLATIFDLLDTESPDETTFLYMSCSSSHRGVAAKKLSVDSVCNTLLYLLYDRARRDEKKLKQLEDCNKVFAIPEKIEKARSSALSNIIAAERLPDFADAFMAIATLLDVSVVVAIDEVDSLDQHDQEELSKRLQGILVPSNATKLAHRSTKFLVGRRSSSTFYSQLKAIKNRQPLLWSINVGDLNSADMRNMLEDALKGVTGLAEFEQKEAASAILQKAGSNFAYVSGIAIPFMREPFKRPLSDRLQHLPEGMDGVYHNALRKMGGNYIDLLRTALLWSLLAPVPLRLGEIMDAYQGTYQERGLRVEKQAIALSDGRFPKSSTLEIEQLQGARGPFLRLELEPRSDQYLVRLQDPLQIHDFCFSSAGAHPQKADVKAHLCTRCEFAKDVTDSLAISKKDGHLRLALECIRAMNNAVFQRRSTNGDKIPLWSQSDLLNRVPKDKVAPHKDSLNELRMSRAQKLASNKIDESEVAKASSQRRTRVTTQPGWRKPKRPSDVAQASSGDVSLSGKEKRSNMIQGLASPQIKKIPEEPDESQDDEDEVDINFTDIPNANQQKETASDPDCRTYRYEMGFWYYHILQAESLWTPAERSKSSAWDDLFDELDFWVTQNTAWFKRWQLWDATLASYQGSLDPLHVAAYLGLTSWVSHLLSKGAQVNATNDKVPKTPLQVAADKVNSLEMLRLLLVNGADPNTSINSTPAFQKWLLKRSELADIQLMLKSRGDPTVVNKENHWTALHSFAWQGEDVRALELLLHHKVNGVGPDINACDDKGNTPLHVLLLRREVPKVLLQAFLRHGANVDAENRESVRPLQMACLYGDLEALRILCLSGDATIDDEDEEGDTALQQAAMGNHTDCVEFLVKERAKPNIPNRSGKVALHNAALYGTRKCLQILLDHGAMPNIADNHNRTPLFCACLNVATEENAKFMVDYLLKSNIPLSEINLPTKRRRTPLHEAAAHGFEYVVGKLIERAKASNDIESLLLNEQDTRKSRTPLHRAAWSGQAGCVRLLLEANANVALRNNNGKTALTLAYEKWALANHQNLFQEIVSLLIDADTTAAVADPELVAVCATNGSLRLLEQLSKIGADFNRQDQYGWTPMELARHHQQEEAAHFLERQAAWAAMSASRWTRDTRTHIEGNGTSITHTSGDRICISTIKPLPAGLQRFYFEITIGVLPMTGDAGDNSHKDFPVVAIGFCTISGSAITFPGWPPRATAPSARSWGYHGQDGCLFDSSREEGSEAATGMPYRAGHTIGCGVDLSTQTIWFTRDGQKLATEFDNVQGRLFPLLGLKDKIMIETNFTGPFVWREGATSATSYFSSSSERTGSDTDSHSSRMKSDGDRDSSVSW